MLRMFPHFFVCDFSALVASRHIFVVGHPFSRSPCVYCQGSNLLMSTAEEAIVLSSDEDEDYIDVQRMAVPAATAAPTRSRSTTTDWNNRKRVPSSLPPPSASSNHDNTESLSLKPPASKRAKTTSISTSSSTATVATMKKPPPPPASPLVSPVMAAASVATSRNDTEGKDDRITTAATTTTATAAVLALKEPPIVITDPRHLICDVIDHADNPPLFSIGGNCDYSIMGHPGLKIHTNKAQQHDDDQSHVSLPLSKTQARALMMMDGPSFLMPPHMQTATATAPTTASSMRMDMDNADEDSDATAEMSTPSSMKMAMDEENGLSSGNSSPSSLSPEKQLLSLAPYAVGQDVLAKDKHAVYEAKVLNVELDIVPKNENCAQPVFVFLVHYKGWNSRFDKWLRKEDLMNDTPTNRKLHLQQEEKAKHVAKGGQHPPMEDVRLKDTLLCVGDVVYSPFPGEDPENEDYFWGRIIKKYNHNETTSSSTTSKLYDIKFHDGDYLYGIGSNPLCRLPEVMYLMDTNWLDEDRPPKEYLLDQENEDEEKEQEQSQAKSSPPPGSTQKNKLPTTTPPTQKQQQQQQQQSNAQYYCGDIKKWMPDQVSFGNPKYDSMLNNVLQLASSKVNIDPSKVTATLDKVLLQLPGNNPEKKIKIATTALPATTVTNDVTAIVGMMLIVLPCVYSGGLIQVLEGKTKALQQGQEHEQQMQVERPVAICSYDFSSFNAYECAYAFHYGSSSQFALQPLLTGSRLILVYQVLQTDLTIPRIIYRDEGRIYRELIAAIEAWTDCNEGNSASRIDKLPLLCIPQEENTTIPLSEMRSKAKGKDLKVLKLLDRAIADGSDLEYDIVSAQYEIHGIGKRIDANGGTTTNVWDHTTKEKMTLITSRFGKLEFDRDAENIVHPEGYFKKTQELLLDTIFQRRYDVSVGNYATTGRKIFRGKTCVLVWKRSHTYDCIVKKSDGQQATRIKIFDYIIEKTADLDDNDGQLDLWKKTFDPIFKSALSRYHRLEGPTLEAASDLVVRFNDLEMAKSLIRQLPRYASSRASELQCFIHCVYHPLAQAFGSSLPDTLQEVVKENSFGNMSAAILKIIASPSSNKECGIAKAEAVLGFCKRMNSASAVENPSRIELARDLGLREGLYFSNTDRFSNYGMGKILSFLCQEARSNRYSSVTEEAVGKLLASLVRLIEMTLPQQTSLDNLISQTDIDSIRKSLQSSGGSSVVTPLASRKTGTDENSGIRSSGRKSPPERFFSVEGVDESNSPGWAPSKRPSQTKSPTASAARHSHLLSCFVKEISPDLCSRIVLKAIDEASNKFAPDVPRDEQLNQATKYVMSLIRDPNIVETTAGHQVMKSLSEQLVIEFARKVVGDRSDEHYKRLSASIKSFPERSVEVIICFLCDTRPSLCETSLIIAFVASLTSVLLLDRTNRDISKNETTAFDHFFTAPCLSSFYNRCREAEFLKCFGSLEEYLELGVAAGFVLSLLGHTNEKEGQAGRQVGGLNSELVGKIVLRFANRVANAESSMINASLLATETSVGESSPIAWPTNCAGFLIRQLCENSKNRNRAPSTVVTNEEARVILKFLEVVFVAIASEKSKPAIKSESDPGSCKRLMSKSDLLAIFEYLGANGIDAFLNRVAEKLPLAIASDFIFQLCKHSDDSSQDATSYRATSSAEALARITVESMNSSRALEEVHSVATALLISFIKKHLGSGVSGLRNFHLALPKPRIRDALHYLCEDLQPIGNNNSIINTKNTLQFISIVFTAMLTKPAGAATSYLFYQENTFSKQDFRRAIEGCGFEKISGIVLPALKALSQTGRISECALLLDLTMGAASASEKKVIMPQVAIASAAVLLQANLQACDKAFCSIFVMAAYFELACATEWITQWNAAMTCFRIPPLCPIKCSPNLPVTTHMWNFLQAFDDTAIIPFLIEAETTLSMGNDAEMKPARVKVATFLHGLASRTIPHAQAKISAGARVRPTSTWKVCDTFYNNMNRYLSASSQERVALNKFRYFLESPCQQTKMDYVPLDQHNAYRNVFRPLIESGVLQLDFYLPSNRWRLKAQKKKKTPLLTNQPVPFCCCRQYGCPLNGYHSGRVVPIKTSDGDLITERTISNLKEGLDFFETLSKGLDPAPDVEIVAPPPPPEIEVVELLGD